MQCCLETDPDVINVSSSLDEASGISFYPSSTADTVVLFVVKSVTKLVCIVESNFC